MWDGDELIGTLRVLFRHNGPFLEDDFYQWQWLSEISGYVLNDIIQRTALLDRAVVKPAYRRSGVYTTMLNYACEYAQEHNMDYMLSSFAASNTNALAWTQKNHFNLHPDILTTHTGKWYLAYKQLTTIFSPEIAAASKL